LQAVSPETSAQAERSALPCVRSTIPVREPHDLSETNVHDVPAGLHGAQGQRCRLRLGELLPRTDSERKAERPPAKNGDEAARAASYERSGLQGTEAWRARAVGQSADRPDGRAPRSHSTADRRERRARHSCPSGGTAEGNLVIQPFPGIFSNT